MRIKTACARNLKMIKLPNLRLIFDCEFHYNQRCVIRREACHRRCSGNTAKKASKIVKLFLNYLYYVIILIVLVLDSRLYSFFFATTTLASFTKSQKSNALNFPVNMFSGNNTNYRDVGKMTAR